MFMENGHKYMMNLMSKYWEKQAHNLSAFDTLSLIEWCYTYLKELK